MEAYSFGPLEDSNTTQNEMLHVTKTWPIVQYNQTINCQSAKLFYSDTPLRRGSLGIIATSINYLSAPKNECQCNLKQNFSAVLALHMGMNVVKEERASLPQQQKPDGGS